MLLFCVLTSLLLFFLHMWHPFLTLCLLLLDVFLLLLLTFLLQHLSVEIIIVLVDFEKVSFHDGYLERAAQWIQGAAL